MCANYVTPQLVVYKYLCQWFSCTILFIAHYSVGMWWLTGWKLLLFSMAAFVVYFDAFDMRVLLSAKKASLGHRHCFH